MPNSVLTMFHDHKMSVEDRANDLNERQVAIQEVTAAWNAIRSLEGVEGWKELARLAKALIETQRAKIVDGAVENADFARGELKALQWFLQAPSLAEAHLIAAQKAQEALDVDKDNFVLDA